MKHLSDEDMVQELEKLGKAFQPTTIQKEKVRRQLFQSSRTKKNISHKFISTIHRLTDCSILRLHRSVRWH